MHKDFCLLAKNDFAWVPERLLAESHLPDLGKVPGSGTRVLGGGPSVTATRPRLRMGRRMDPYRG